MTSTYGITPYGVTGSESARFLLYGLPPWMRKDQKSGNYKVLKPVGLSLEGVENDLESIDEAANIQTANSIDQIHRLAKLVDTSPKENETVDKYRLRALGEFRSLTSETTADEILSTVSEVLDIDSEGITYREPYGRVVHFEISSTTIEDSPLSRSELRELMRDHIAAGFSLQMKSDGTFTYLSEDAYSGDYVVHQDGSKVGYESSELNSDPSKGHDGLDQSGDPKDTGGTYAGLIN